MIILHKFEQLQTITQPIFWALGFFDGMHLGHQAVIQAARAQGALCGMLSFAQHPLSILCPARAPKLLQPHLTQRITSAEACGVDVLLLLDFTAELAALSPTTFLKQLSQHAPVAGIAMGANCHFGHLGQGDANFVQSYAKAQGWQCHIAPMSQLSGERICSSRIRETLAAGDLALTQSMLGRPFSILGTVEHGQKLARQLGFATANITLPAHAALPPFGVYAVSCQLGDQQVHGIANLGLRPTIKEELKCIRLETHFLDWSGDLYGHELVIELHTFIRPEQRFEGIEALKAAIAQDVAFLRMGNWEWGIKTLCPNGQACKA